MSNQTENISETVDHGHPIVIPEPEVIEVPVTVGFCQNTPPIGVVKILKSALPDTPNFVLSIGGKILERIDGEVTKFEILEFSLISDEEYKGYLAQV